MKIVLCGASSVGKSTLAEKWCASHKEYCHIKEIARDIMKEKSITTADLKKSLSSKEKSLFLQLQYDIIDEQDRKESEMAANGVPFISDRGPDPFVYVQTYCSEQTLVRFSEHPSFIRCMERYRAGSLCFILCPLGFSTNDGVRLVQSTSDQKKYNEKLSCLFHEYRVPFIHMNVTDIDKRLAMLEEAVKGRLPLPKLEGEKPCLSIPFNVTNSSSLTQSVSLRQVKITKDSVNMSFSNFRQGLTNRMVERYDQDLLVLCFDNKVSPSLVLSILRPGILVNGEQYNFLGCSSSGLKSRTCYMLQGPKDRVNEVRNECGDFSKIKTVSKRLKRIGMLFSEVRLTKVTVHDDNVCIMDDVESPNGDIFTDGCGQIGTEVAEQIMESTDRNVDLLVKGRRYLPSVYQIRYQGCKGVVAINTLVEKKNQLMIRASMRKFNPGLKPFSEIGLCDYSKPYSYGHLNKQFIMLLSGLGIADEVFVQKQKKHFEYLEKMMTDPEIAIMVCCWKNRPGIAARIASHLSTEALISDVHIKNELNYLKSQLFTKIEGKSTQRPKIKLRILVEESRNIFGVCDPMGVLEYGQCFVRPTIRGKPCTITGNVTVGKNPCYLLGDIRVLKAVDHPSLHHLVDCIVFPIKGKRPHPSEIAGSDLDGDQYFVTWDKDLVPPTVVEPYGYPSVGSDIGGNVDEYSMIDYFSRQNQVSAMMGKIDGYYMYWASKCKEGVKSDKCQNLGKLFSRSVDATKTGDTIKIPHYLEPGKEVLSLWQSEIGGRDKSSHVWEKLENIAFEESERKKEEFVHDVLDCDGSVSVSEEFVWDLLEYRTAGISEFEIFLVARKWCLAQNPTDKEATDKMVEFSESVNFAMFTTHEKLCAMDWGIPMSLVTNALSNSRILTPSMMHYFSFTDSHSYWNLYISPSNFQWKHLLRALFVHRESMVVFQLPDEMVFAIHFLTKLKPGDQEIPQGSAVTYFFSPQFNLHLRRVLGAGYAVNINDELMQLYQGNIRSTFMWIKSEDLSRGMVEYDRVSIDLTRFKRDILRENGHPRINKQNFSTIECYVKCFTSDETGYFDLYEVDHDLNPVYTEELDILPVDEFPQPLENIQHSIKHNIIQELNDEYSEELALSYLETLASDCDCVNFLKVIQVMTSQTENPNPSATAASKHLLHLLTVMATSYPPFPVPQDVKETLQILLATVPIQKPLDCLCMLDRLCRLQCQDLVGRYLMLSVEQTSFQDFCVCMKEWSIWAFIPLDLATSFANHIVGLYRQVYDGESDKTFEELIHIAEDPSMKTSSEETEKEQYVGEFLYLLVQQFISEVHSMKANKQTAISRMKAYKHQAEASSSKNPSIGFRSTNGIAPNTFKEGSYVAIRLMVAPPDRNTKDTHSHVLVGIGQIVQFSHHPTYIVVEVIEPVATCLERSADLGKGHWTIQILGNVTGFKRASDALFEILEKESKCSNLVPVLVHRAGHEDRHLATDSHHSHPNNSLEANNEGNQFGEGISGEFNFSQRQAIGASLSRRLTLIHGPPGTGKTRVACEIVRLACQRNKSNPVLVCAETNMAVDNLARKLLSLGIRVVRIGGEVSADVRPVTLEQQIEIRRIELGKAKRNLRFPDTGLAKKILKAAQVIAVTCTGAGDSVLSELKFEFVVVDEATQATEPVTLIPITHHCCQLTLIGDPQQLAPTLSENLAGGKGGLAVSLFHRLQKLLPSFFLELQYRMHPALMEFPSAMFYAGKLKSAVSYSDRKLPPILGADSLEKNPLLFIDTSGKEQRIGTSPINQTEIDVIKDMVKLLLDSNIAPTSIAILTPYVAQACEIRQCLPLHFDVSTIDSFQGRERDIVIFSTVRCNTRGTIGFLDDQYRMNVLLTRAKCCLIGVGSKHTLTNSSPLWTEWFKDEHVTVISRDVITKCATVKDGAKSIKSKTPPKPSQHKTGQPKTRST